MAAFGKMLSLIVITVALLAINSNKACAGDPDMLQDICVADPTSSKRTTPILDKLTFTLFFSYEPMVV